MSGYPVLTIGSGKKLKEKIDPFTIEEFHLIEATCRERFPEHYPFILCMARTSQISWGMPIHR